MKPREWRGCVVGVLPDGYVVQFDTILRAWRGKRTKRLRRVLLRHHGQRVVADVTRVAAGDLAGLRVLVLGGAW